MNPEISSINLFNVLNKYMSSPFIFVGKPGSHGDALIFQGAKNIFDTAGINYQNENDLESRELNITQNSVIYINGSGSLNNIWRPIVFDIFYKAINSRAHAVILGPSTFTDDTEFLKEKLFSNIKGIPDKKVYIFCREQTSFSTLKKISPSNFELLIDHDTALNLHAQDLMKHVPKGKHVLYAIRQDKEQSDFKRINLLSLWVDPISYCKTFEDWVNLHANSKKIVTNRLHSSILGMILGKEVTLLPNSYHKNRSVWEYSLKDRGVQWQDKIEVSAPASMLMKSKLYKWIGNSNKVKKLTNKYYGLE